MTLVQIRTERRHQVATFSELVDRKPAYALVAGVDLVVVRFDDQVSVLYGRCLHRGALMADGSVVGEDLVCGLHGWDYRLTTGVSAYDNKESLHRFCAQIDRDADAVYVDAVEIKNWQRQHPQAYDRSAYLGLYADNHGTPVEPNNAYVQRLAREGLQKLGHHGLMSAMGVPHSELPRWQDVQIITAQLARQPLQDGIAVGSEVIIGPRAAKPLRLEIPIFVSDMSFGALSEEAKTALALGAERAGTGICSGEGGVLPA
ncbi:MAG TPA: glutamate synthase, partial [Nannocystis exedens]|nr:glutamate synthase [Nannocystis exedens]